MYAREWASLNGKGAEPITLQLEHIKIESVLLKPGVLVSAVVLFILAMAILVVGLLW
ncbi:MAG: hypothetical protein JSW27_14815 [Phycisphaerales bacterium]|nr:MAG: hypothetical protein JSW27_14815 [Phycisphaerales bacterium]